MKSIAYKGLKGVAGALGVRSLPCKFNGAWVRLPTAEWGSFAWNYEPYMAAVIRGALAPGGTFVDLGAHFGVWSLFAASIVGPGGTALAVEPSPAFDVLDRSRTWTPALRTRRVGIADRSGELTFAANGRATSGSFVESVTRMNAGTAAALQPLTVPVLTVDALLAEERLTPALVKLDVEGFEGKALAGAADTLARARSQWVVEVHPEQLALSGGSPEAVAAVFEAARYRTTVIDRNPNGIYTLHATPAEQPAPP